jgi:archaeal type IV pilus assembly protein PilA
LRIKNQDIGEKEMNIGKSIRKFRRNTRAISPVIATLLMIAIAVVASLVTYAWVMGYMNFTTEKTGKAIQIQSVSYPTTAPSGNVFTVYVQNVGDSDLTLSSVFINGAAATGSWTPAALAKGNTAYMNATATGSLGTGVQSITIKVTSTDGTFSQITQQFTIKP